MGHSSRAAAGVLVVLGILAAIVAVWSMPIQPAPLPAGAVPLSLHARTSTWHWPIAFLTACATSRLVPVVIGDEDGAMSFRSAETGVSIDVEWPAGFSARRLGDDAQLVSPEGWVIGHAGDVLDSIGGSALDSGGFSVCFSSPGEYAPRP